jgi:thymidine kinase
MVDIYPTSYLEVICGPMKCSKTTTLIENLSKVEYSNLNFKLYKPNIDTRFSEKEAISRFGIKLDSIPISTHYSYKIVEDLEDEQIIAIDEANFFDKSIVKTVEKLLEMERSVLISGLDLGFRGVPFGSMHYLMALADKVTKLSSCCNVCGQKANRTQRLINGKPATYNSPLILVGDEEYEPRCVKHHEVPAKPL